VRPTPRFGVFTEAEADLTIAIAVLHNQSADESIRRRLKAMFDGYLDPADDLVLDAGNERGLVFGALRKGFNPGVDFVEGTLVSELLNQRAGFRGVTWLDHADQELRFEGRAIAHGNHVLMRTGKGASRLLLTWLCRATF